MPQRLVNVEAAVNLESGGAGFGSQEEETSGMNGLFLVGSAVDGWNSGG